MENKLKIINVDGTKGVGKTSQINMLARYFKTLGFTVSVLKSATNPEEMVAELKLIDYLLFKDSKAIIIVDGSVARPMVTELISGIPGNQVIDKFKHVMHEYEGLDKKYGIVGLLLVMDEIHVAEDRFLRKKQYTPEITEEFGNHVNELDIVSGMRTFNNHIASRSIEFHVFNIEPEDTMMEIHKEILKYLSGEYNLPKPVKNQDDW